MIAKTVLTLVVGISMVCFSGIANATLFTFDDVPGATQNSFGSIGTYNGFNFSGGGNGHGLDWIDTVSTSWPYGAVSGDFTALNNYGGSGIITAADGEDFTFDGLYARIWGSPDNREVPIKGYLDGNLVWTSNILLTNTWTQYSGVSGAIDSLEIDFGNHFLLDNLVLNDSTNPVPEPASLILFGLGSLGMLLRRKK